MADGAFFVCPFHPWFWEPHVRVTVRFWLLCCAATESLCCEPLQQSWGSVTVKALVLWTHQTLLVTVPAVSALLRYPGYWEGSLCDSWLAPDLRAPNLNPSPLPSGFLSVPWRVKNKGFTMASCCICFNTRRCFLLTWTLVSHRDKQMAFR